MNDSDRMVDDERPAKAPKLANKDDDLDLDDDDAVAAEMEVEALDEDEENGEQNAKAKKEKKEAKDTKKKADNQRTFKKGGIDLDAIRNDWYPHFQNNLLEKNSLLLNQNVSFVSLECLQA